MHIHARGARWLGFSSAATLLIAGAAPAGPPDQHQIVEMGKSATAMVDVQGVRFGSAFCIDSRGVFITNAHVLAGASKLSDVKIIVHPGQKDELVLVPEAMFSDKDEDLATVVTSASPKLTALKLGETTNLRETDAVIAFGFPFGDALAMDGKKYPTVSVSTGKVTALRKDPNDRLVSIQVDASLNPGNSGGPVLDSTGAVVGVTMAGIPGAALNLAIPVEMVVRQTTRPALVVARTLDAVSADALEKPYVLKGRAWMMHGPAPSVQVFVGSDVKPTVATFEPGTDRFRVSLTFVHGKKDSTPAPTTIHVKIVADQRDGDGFAEAQRDIPVTPSAKLAGASEAGPPIVFKPVELPDGKKTLALPGPAADVELAGAGRYILLPIPEQSVLAVVDVCEARVVKILPMMSADTVVAGGANMIVLVDPRSKMFQRYSLKTFARETTAPMPTTGTTASIAMGWQGSGPMMVSSSDGSFGKVELMDPRTLRLLPALKYHGMVRGGPSQHLRASAAGRRFCAWSTDGSPSGMALFTLRGDAAECVYEHQSAGFLRPTANGLVYSYAAVYQEDLKTRVETAKDQTLFIPAVDETCFLEVTLPDRGSNEQKFPRAALHFAGDHKVLGSVGDLEELAGLETYGTHPDLDQRVVLVPGAKVIVTLKSGNRELVFRRVDVDDMLEKSGVDFLYVRTPPTRSVRKGERFEHKLDVASKAGGVTMTLEHGPDGMTLSKVGVLSWKVPTEGLEGNVSVIILLRDVKGQEKYFTFQVSVE